MPLDVKEREEKMNYALTNNNKILKLETKSKVMKQITMDIAYIRRKFHFRCMNKLCLKQINNSFYVASWDKNTKKSMIRSVCIYFYQSKQQHGLFIFRMSW